MNNSNNKINIRWVYLAIGIIAMLFAGIIYAWSILKSPFSQEFNWTPSNLALNFTITMCFFCIGGLLGSKLDKKLGTRIALIISAVAATLGFILTSVLSQNSLVLLYLTYGVLTGTGIGIAYNVIVSTVSKWFPDKKGICSGALMMGFGASTLALGTLAGKLFDLENVGWRKTYIILGVAIGVVILISSFILRKPTDDIIFPESKKKKSNNKEIFESKDFSTSEMLKRLSFWLAFIFLVCLSAVGSSVISFAKDLAVSTNASSALATTLVGVLSVCNGVGRILTGFIFDALGRKKTMIISNIVTICAAGIILLAVSISSLPLCILGLCITGISYGSSPTICAAFTSSFYGMKNLSSNIAIMTCNLVPASFVATFCSKLLTSSGGYVAPFILLLSLAVLGLILNFLIKRP